MLRKKKYWNENYLWVHCSLFSYLFASRWIVCEAAFRARNIENFVMIDLRLQSWRREFYIFFEGRSCWGEDVWFVSGRISCWAGKFKLERASGLGGEDDRGNFIWIHRCNNELLLFSVVVVVVWISYFQFFTCYIDPSVQLWPTAIKYFLWLLLLSLPSLGVIVLSKLHISLAVTVLSKLHIPLAVTVLSKLHIPLAVTVLSKLHIPVSNH